MHALLLIAALLAGSVQDVKNDAAVAAPKIDKEKKPDAGFIKKHESFVEIAKKGGVDVLFLGDSITAGWAGAGKEVWAKSIAPLKAANFGIGGDRTQHVLWRITNGELEGISPKAVVLMIGTNNSGNNTPEQIAEGITVIVKTLREKLPKARILLLAVFPRGAKNDKTLEVTPAEGLQPKIEAINKIIAKLDDGASVQVLDIGPKFLDEKKGLPKAIMPDFLHLSPKGYEIWAEAIKEPLAKMLAS